MRAGIASRRTVLATGAVLMGASACGRGPSSGDGVGEPVTYIAGFGLKGHDAWVITGIDRGHFARAGLSVVVKPGGGTLSNLALIASGRAQFATVDLAGLLLARDTRGGVFRVVSVTHQRSVSCVTTLMESGITRPSDLAGRKLGYFGSGVNYLMWPMYARRAGVDARKVAMVPISPPQLPAMLAIGKVDAIMETTLGTTGVQAAAGGRQPITFPYSDYIGDLYGNVVITSTEFARRRPEVVRRFRSAAIAGVTDAIDHPEWAGAAWARQVKVGDSARVAEAAMRAMSTVARADGTVGAVSEQRVMKVIALLQAEGLIRPGLTPDMVMDVSGTGTP